MNVPKAVMNLADYAAKTPHKKYALQSIHLERTPGGQALAVVSNGYSMVATSWDDKEENPVPGFSANITLPKWNEMRRSIDKNKQVKVVESEDTKSGVQLQSGKSSAVASAPTQPFPDWRSAIPQPDEYITILLNPAVLADAALALSQLGCECATLRISTKSNTSFTMMSDDGKALAVIMPRELSEASMVMLKSKLNLKELGFVRARSGKASDAEPPPKAAPAAAAKLKTKPEPEVKKKTKAPPKPQESKPEPNLSKALDTLLGGGSTDVPPDCMDL